MDEENGYDWKRKYNFGQLWRKLASDFFYLFIF